MATAPLPRTPFTLAGMHRGVLRSLPLLPGIFIYGAAFGVLAREAHLGMVQAALISAIVFSGSAQLAALLLLSTGAGLLAIMATVFIVNTRYLLYGAALRPWLGGVSPLKAYTSLFFMGDTNWIIAMQANAEGESDAAFMFGSGMIMFVPWVGGTMAGMLLGALMGNPAAFGLDFFLVAFCVALAMGMIKGRGDLWIIAGAGAAALIVNALAPSGWTTAIAGIAGGLVAYLRYDDADR